MRQCHGDLHLRNIVLLDGRPTLFDGVEFNDEISCTDVLYDLAFLLMDLWRRKLPRHANAVWNRYLAETGDLDGVSLLPLFLSCRAAVRAKTSATAAQLQNDVQRRNELHGLAREYLAMAEQLLHPPRAIPHRGRRSLGLRKVDAGSRSRASRRRRAWRGRAAQRRDSEAPVRRPAAGAPWSGRIFVARCPNASTPPWPSAPL